MPLDSIGDNQPDIFYRYNRYLGAELKFAWLPKICNLTNQRIWLKYAYRLTAIWYRQPDVKGEFRWHEKKAHIMWLLKR
jgi:hypothetical protein